MPSGAVVTGAAALVALALLVWPGARWWPGGLRGPGGRHPPVDHIGSHMVRRWAPRAAGWWGPRSRSARQPWVAEFADVAAVGLDAGLDLASAALTSARSPGVVDRAPWLPPLLDTSVAEGRGVATLLEVRADLSRDERADLGLLVAAWRLAEETGATASTVTAAAASSIRGRREARDRAEVVVAGPRASMRLLSALPLVGPVAGTLVGLGPDRLYASVASRVLALAGVALTIGGWWWARRLLRRASRPGRTDGRTR